MGGGNRSSRTSLQRMVPLPQAYPPAVLRGKERMSPGGSENNVRWTGNCRYR